MIHQKLHTLAALWLLLAACAVYTNVAHAVDASGPGVQAVANRLALVPIYDRVQNEYFRTASNPVPQWTPDGGVFQYFQGAHGEGAIYWHPQKSGGRAHTIYGDILRYWRTQGYEAGLGYPQWHEQPADPFRHPCGPTVRRSQEFGSSWVVCWDGSRTWHVSKWSF